MANTDLYKCPEQLQKLANCLSNVCAQAKMAEAQMKFFNDMIYLQYDAEFLHDSVIIYSKKEQNNE